MELLYSRCAGLDVHKDSVVACARIADRGEPEHEVRVFGTTTSELCKLSDWLRECGCTHVAMEATGVYWKPVWHVLEESFELVLANAAHIRNVPGRKTDVNDATWISNLLAHGLITSSFVPPAPIQELRDLTRTRKQLVRERTQHTQRIQKVLEDANLKLASVISDVLGVSGRRILNALAGGATNPEQLANLASERLRASRKSLVEALTGKVTTHHRFLLRVHLAHIDAINQAIEAVEGQLGAAVEPFRERAARLTTIPGVSETVAQILVAEIGVDMSRFPTPVHLISWAGLCPGHNESAGKRRSTRLRKGAPWLKTALVQAGWAAARAKDTYLKAQFLRIKSRRGPKKAVVAVAASILTAAYFILRDRVDYRDLGSDYFDRRDRVKAISRLVKRLEGMGYKVGLEPAA